MHPVWIMYLAQFSNAYIRFRDTLHWNDTLLHFLLCFWSCSPLFHVRLQSRNILYVQPSSSLFGEAGTHVLHFLLLSSLFWCGRWSKWKSVGPSTHFLVCFLNFPYFLLVFLSPPLGKEEVLQMLWFLFFFKGGQEKKLFSRPGGRG